MAGKSKATRKKNKQRAAEVKAKVDNAPLAHQQGHGIKTGEIDATEPVTVHLKKTETTVNGKPVYVDEAIVATVRRCMDAEVAAELDQEYWRERALEQIVGAWKRKTNGV